MTRPDDERVLTMSIPEAGRKYFNVSRNTAYALARTGKIPTVVLSERVRRVPVRAMEKILDSAGT
jgi:predicted site-specific integrase-resolvase